MRDDHQTAFLYRHVVFLTLAMLAVGHCRCSAENSAAGDWVMLIDYHDSSQFNFLNNEQLMIHMGMNGWGTNWAWTTTASQGRWTSEVLNQSFPITIGASKIIINEHAEKISEKTISFQYNLSADADIPLTELSLSFLPDRRFGASSIFMIDPDGKSTEITVPIEYGHRNYGKASKIEFSSKQLGVIECDVTPPCSVSTDGALRLALAEKLFKKGTSSTSVSFSFQSPASFAITPSDIKKRTVVMEKADWFPMVVANDNGPSVIGCEEWLEHPAGRHGKIRIVDDHFQFDDGSRIKFWGTNLAFYLSAPSKSDADFTAARFAKYGINCVRMHKFTCMGGMGIGDDKDARMMVPDGLKRLDYFAKQLSDRGVYYGWSHTFQFQIGPANVKDLVGGAEIMKNCGGNTYGLINFAEDVQDLLIQRTVALLKHVNPYTNVPYCQDPALAFIELQNEDDVFFYTTATAYSKCPTYRKLLIGRFCDWLIKKYTTQAALSAAWGGSLANQSLEKRDIEVESNPWFEGVDHLPQVNAEARQRLLDNAAFLHDVQDKFYNKFVGAIRDTGYRGPLIGSPWQAPAMLPLLYNLKSDAEVGTVDRHNYFGWLFGSMLSKPGSGYLSSGLQQVLDRPFALSEWISQYPCCYSAEGPVLVAAYGLGLQGWDASYEFQSGHNHAKTYIDAPIGQNLWNADLPNQIGQAPVLARMIDRGDITEGDVISVHQVSSKNLAEGSFDFSDQVKQEGDIKSFAGSTPPEALAAGRVAIAFNEDAKPSIFPDMSKFTSGKVITSSTNQLRWDYSGKGFITIDSNGTKGAVGFVGGKTLSLNGISMKIDTDYASVLITSLDIGKTIVDCHHALISATARECNSGFSYTQYDQQVAYSGKLPVLLEPVKASISITMRGIDSVNILDQDGRETGRSTAVMNGSFIIDEANDKSFYYEVIFK